MSGGHYLDTGNGPRPLAVTTARMADGAVQIAYQAYMDHRPGCSQCEHHALVCGTARELWDAYIAARRSTP